VIYSFVLFHDSSLEHKCPCGQHITLVFICLFCGLVGLKNNIHMLVIRRGVWIDNWIFWTLITRNYR
jgi:hypothetical protein